MGMLIVISAPSGGGKNAIIAELVRLLPNAVRLVTSTTRLPRPGEEQGKDYFFLSREEFLQKNEQGDFLESNEFGGAWYGTDRKRLSDALSHASYVFAALDVNGKESLDREGVPHLSIFALPDSLSHLRSRIERRGGMSEEDVERRLAIAKVEIDRADEYDDTVVNREGHLDDTIREIRGIIDKKSKLA